MGYNSTMTINIKYHVLGPDNADCLIGADVFDNPVDLAQLAAFQADAGHELVFATNGRRVVGMVSGTVLLHPDKAPAFFINEVSVVEDMRREGIAMALCERMLEVARARGCKGVWLATEADNVEARALYRKLRARETAEIVVCDWDGAMDS